MEMLVNMQMPLLLNDIMTGEGSVCWLLQVIVLKLLGFTQT